MLLNTFICTCKYFISIIKQRASSIYCNFYIDIIFKKNIYIFNIFLLCIKVESINLYYVEC
jgi:hypothetical protein